MRAPIFADYRGDLCVFRSVEAAERYIEPIDADNQECTVFDADGRVLSVRSDPPRSKITAPERPEFSPDVLSACLRRFLLALGYSNAEIVAASLTRLVQLAEPHAER